MTARATCWPRARRCFTPVDLYGNAIAATYTADVSGTITKTSACYSVSNGVLQSGVQLVSSSYARPHVCYLMTIINALTKTYVIGPKDGFSCIQPTGPSLELSAVGPNLGNIPLSSNSPSTPSPVALQQVWPAMKGLDWWLPLEDAPGTSAADATGNGHTGTISGTGYVWTGAAGIQLGSATMSIPNAGGRIGLGMCAYFPAGGGPNNYAYVYSLAASGMNGTNIGTNYGPAAGVYNGGLSYFPLVGFSNGASGTNSASGFTGNHCVEITAGEGAGGASGSEHIVVDGQEVGYTAHASAYPGVVGGAQLTNAVNVIGGTGTRNAQPVTVFSAWGTSATTAETVAQAAARTASEIARLKSLGVPFGPLATSQAYDSTCAIDGTSIDQGFMASGAPTSNLLALDFPCTIHDFSVSGQGPLDMDAGFADRAGSVYHPKAARNIAYHGGVTNGIVNFAEPPAQAFLNELSWNRQAHAQGYKTIVSTMLSRSGTVGGVAVDTLAQQHNALMLANGDEFDCVVNLAASPLFGATGAYSSTAIFADGTHPNTTGQAYYAAAERAVITPAATRSSSSWRLTCPRRCSFRSVFPGRGTQRAQPERIQTLR